MTDDIQKSPAGETVTTPKRPRRTPAKKAESPTNTAEKAPAPKAAKPTAKTAGSKSPRPRVQKSSPKHSADAEIVADIPPSAPLTEVDEPVNAKPKPRSRRRASPKVDTVVADSVNIAAEAEHLPTDQEISLPTPPAPKEKKPVKRRVPKAKTPSVEPEQTPELKPERTPELKPEQTPDRKAEQALDSTPAPAPEIPAFVPEVAAEKAEPVTIPRQEQSLAQAEVTELVPSADPHEGIQAPAHDRTASADVENSSPPAVEEASPEGEAPARKSRRGRRGGRGRSKNRLREVQNTEEDAREHTAGEDAETGSLRAEDSPLASPARHKAAPHSSKRPSKPVPVEAEAPEDADEARDSEKVGRRKMFISVVPGEQVEVALVEEGAIHEYYLEMLHQAKTKGNIYKGVIHNIDTNLQAAFVNYGANKNGFLQIDEVHPEYYLTHHETMKGKKFPPMQKVLKAGQEVLVQVVKEPSGSKGAFLTTWLSLAGRFLVLTPGQEQIGVSRKVENDEERARLREMMNGIDPGEGLGVIVRTVSAGTSKTTLKNDLQYLKRVWKDIRKRGTSEPTPALIYQEPGLAERAVRDYLTDDVCEVWVDDGPEAESLRETVSLLFPRKGDLVKVHSDLRQTLWERFNIQRQLEQIYSREVILPSGGRLVFDQTEALMAIDINSGKISGKGNFEAMALRTNVEAAECIARQLKLRDIGGQIVIDFIEMRDKNHIRDVEKTLRNAMKNDRARHDVGRMSSFGLLEIVRQRTASSALAITMEPCPACGGTGLRRNIEWHALQVMREIARLARLCSSGPCQIELATELGLYLLNHKRDRLREMEKQYNVPIEIKIRP
ncbi:MAG: Rne/Rng family ribonuclease [Desulfovibrionaceae bacterium]